MQKILDKLKYVDRYAFAEAIKPSSNLVYQYQILTYRELGDIPKNPMICSICLDTHLDNFLMTCFNIGPFFTHKEPVSIQDVNAGRITFDEYLDKSYEAWQSLQITKKRLSAFAPRVEKIKFSETAMKKVRFERDLDFVTDQESAFGNFKLMSFERPRAVSERTRCRVQRYALQAFHDFCSDANFKEKLRNAFQEMPVFRGARDLLKHLDTHKEINVSSRQFRIYKVLREMINFKPILSDFALQRRHRVTPGRVLDLGTSMTFFGLRDYIENDTYMCLLQDVFLHGPKNYTAHPKDMKLLAIREYLLNFGSVMNNYHYRADNFYQFEVRQDSLHMGVLNTVRALLHGYFANRCPY